MCQLLAQHPDLHSEGNSSPVCTALQNMRRSISDDPFFLSQLDTAFDASYAHLKTAMQGFLRGWYQDCGKLGVVDKNRAWLHAVEMLLQLAPEAKLIVCVRELGQVYGSVEAQHQRTILLDFIDHLADYDRLGRADILFAKDRTIGSPLSALQAVLDLPLAVQQKLYVVRFEDLMARPIECMSHLYAWLGLAPFKIDPDNLSVGLRESDSHYRMKYTHRQFASIRAPQQHAIPPRIQQQIESAYGWFYEMYYPRVAAKG
jgi:sulfotransferase